MRRALQVAVAVLAFIPLFTGLYDVLLGPAMIPGGQPVTASVDSSFRFNSLFWMILGGLVLWMVPRIERVTPLFRLLLSLIFVGGLVRLLSVALTGWPHPVFIAALILELVGMPLLILWHAYLVRAPKVHKIPIRVTDRSRDQEEE